MSDNRLVRRRYWTITKHENGGIEILTIVPDGGKEILPVFSFEGEAALFLQCEAPASGWTARETMTGELVSILYGPCSGVSEVALDPLPEILDKDLMGLISLDRDSFVDVLLEKECPSGLTSRADSNPVVAVQVP